MLIGILVGIVVVFGLISVFGGVLKKIMEVVSLIAKLCLCGGVAMLIVQLLGVTFEKIWLMLLCIVVGAVVLFGLLMLLSARFRLVGYSISYLINSFILMMVVTLLREKVDVSIWLYSLLLLVFPRVMWISDRLATVSEYSHSEYDFWGDETAFYNIVSKDWWENGENSWKNIPLQIFLSLMFYFGGSVTMLAVDGIQNGALAMLGLLVMVALNIVLVLFVRRRVEEEYQDR